MMEQRELLYDVMRSIRCEFLSDLHESPYQEAAVRCATVLEIRDYPLDQWRDAVFYLTGHEEYFPCVEAARNFLVEYEKKQLCGNI